MLRKLADWIDDEDGFVAFTKMLIVVVSLAVIVGAVVFALSGCKNIARPRSNDRYCTETFFIPRGGYSDQIVVRVPCPDPTPSPIPQPSPSPQCEPRRHGRR